MARKRGPKAIWICPEYMGSWESIRKDAVVGCPEPNFREKECCGCPGPVKYIRQDK